MTRRDQFACIESARTNILKWAQVERIPLHKIEFVVPFGIEDLGLSVWFLFETDEQVQRSGTTGWTGRFSARFAEELEGLGYPAEWLSQISFFFDSHENVVRNYEGSYFYRLR